MDNPTFRLKCDLNGAVEEVISDSANLFAVKINNFQKLMLPPFHTRYQTFIQEVLHTGFGMCNKITLAFKTGECSFSLFGVLKREHIYIVALQNPEHLHGIYEDFMKMLNEQGLMLREAQKEAWMKDNAQKEARSNESNDCILAEYMKINNDFANLQRELIQKNHEIQKQEERFREMVTSSPDAQLVLSADGKILFINPQAEKIFGKGAEALSLKPIEIRQNPHTEVCFAINGSTIWAEILKRKLLWEGQKAELLSVRDISERKHAEVEKDKANKLEGVLEMAGATAHEFSQPLQGIRMDIEYVKDQIMDFDNIGQNQDLTGTLVNIFENLERLSDLVRKTQNITKYETKNYTGDTDIIDIDKASE